MSELKVTLKDFVREEEGLGIVELVLIIIVLIALVVIFKDQVAKFIKNLFTKAQGNVDSNNAYN